MSHITVTTAVTAFDYSVMDAETADLAKRTAERLRDHHRRAVREMILIGGDLIRIKQALDHGQFGEWLAAEFGRSDRTAQLYMRAAAVFDAKSEIVSVLPRRLVDQLSSKSTPPGIVGEVVAKLEAGQPVDPELIAGQVEKARQDAALARRQQAQKNRRKASKARQAAAERHRAQAEAERQQREERAAAEAQALIDEVGAEIVRRVVLAADNWEVRAAIFRILGAAEWGMQP